MADLPMYVVDSALEQELLADVSLDEPWALVERFATLVRISGSQDERTAASYIVERLQSWQAPVQVHEPELYLSIPLSASVTVQAPNGPMFAAKTPAFSVSTAPGTITGQVVYLPRHIGPNLADVFSPVMDDAGLDLAGKIVLTEGFSGPDEVSFFAGKGSIGQIFVNPGQRIHWSICTTIWGNPDLDSIDRKPQVVAVDVNRPDGDALIRLAQAGGLQVSLCTELAEGWFRCPLIVVEIPGREEPEKFVLVHGHYDSWDVGVGDNATGDAALLELARALWHHRHRLKRSVRIAWWPGHSTGRYAGSTWYADQFGVDLAENCIAHLDIDSPGCRWADTFDHVCWMRELEGFCQQTIGDVAGVPAHGERPYRAGDYSFNNLGVSGFFMLLSEMSDAKRQELGYYAVGGCGGNIGWHTEDDRLPIADPANLVRDIRVYLAAITRLVNAPVLPLNFVAVTQEHAAWLDAYAQRAGAHFDFGPARAELAVLQASLARFYRRGAELAQRPVGDPEVRRFNAALLELSRILVPLNYARMGCFQQDPAVAIEPLPDLACVRQLAAAAPDSDEQRFCRTQLQRGLNRVVYGYRLAQRLTDNACSGDAP